MVERFLPGYDFRLLVVGNKLVAAARRDPPQVVGDGVHIGARAGRHGQPATRAAATGHATSLTKIRFDDIALAAWQAQGLTARLRARARPARHAAQQRQPVAPAAPPPT